MLFANGVCERDLPRDSSMPSDLLMMRQSVYAIDGFPDDDLLWRIEWLGGVGYKTSVPSEPQIDVSLAQLPKGERNPLSARARSSQVEKRTVKIGVGLLPYIWIGSVWQKRRPVMTNLAAYRSRVSIDTTSFRMVALGMATSLDNAIPRNSYLFGASCGPFTDSFAPKVMMLFHCGEDGWKPGRPRPLKHPLSMICG